MSTLLAEHIGLLQAVQAVGAAQAVLAAVLVLLMPFHGLPETRRLQRFTSSTGRLAVYRSFARAAWLLTLVACILAWGHDLLGGSGNANELNWLTASPWIRPGLWGLVATLGLLFLAQTIYYGSSPRLRLAYARAARHMSFILPVTGTERTWFLFLCVTAGICEELLFRGFLMQFLAGRLEGGPHLGLTAAWLVTSASFGICHLYQGARGVFVCALAGALFGLLALLTGNLVVPILAHFVIDASLLWVYRLAQDNPEEAARLAAGCELAAD